MSPYFKLSKNIGFLSLILLLGYFINLQPCTAQQIAKQSIVKTDYLIYTPPGYDSKTDKNWPLMINLHGSDANVTIETLRSAFLPNLIASGKDFPMLIANPVCNKKRGGWNVDILNKILDDILEEYSVDEDRIYLTGYSMGGYGTWDWVFHNPEKFAAISPIAGCADKTDLEHAWQLRNIPIWIIHGAKDKTIDINCNYEAVRLLKNNGGNPKFTVYSDIGHNLEEIWGKTLINNEWYAWMLRQNRKNNLPKYIQPKRSILEEYCGKYSMDDNTLTITIDNDQLQVSIGKGRTRKVLAESNTVFSFEKSSFIGLRFIKNGGVVSGFELLPQTEKVATKIN